MNLGSITGSNKRKRHHFIRANNLIFFLEGKRYNKLTRRQPFKIVSDNKIFIVDPTMAIEAIEKAVSKGLDIHTFNNLYVKNKDKFSQESNFKKFDELYEVSVEKMIPFRGKRWYIF